MRLRRRNRRREGAKATVDMNSLIDLTFLLLVVFIVTLPTLEQSVHIVLPVGKTAKAQDEKKKNLSISIDKDGKLFLGEAPMTMESLKEKMSEAVASDPDVNVLIRGDVSANYGDIYAVVKTAKECNIKHLGLVSKEN